jgi:hypothetical protein
METAGRMLGAARAEPVQEPPFTQTERRCVG